jgi:hypothetical protein
MSEINSGALVRLAMWAKNMTAIRDGKMEWPGFSYSYEEWERMDALIMCGILVPGMLVWIAYDIDAGPIITAIKWLAIALMAVSTAAGLQKQRKQK